ncbi:MAG: hypothetical protein M9958_06340 [Chitinophagales bacterium]|nr:hypothetical protein [Chitinophagales bacterium]
MGQENIEEFNLKLKEKEILDFFNPYMAVPADSYLEKMEQLRPPDTFPQTCSPIGSRCRGSCEDFYTLCGAGDESVKKCDLFENPISFYGKYGNDDRQQYYVYNPSSNVNPKNEVVVLIHGGAWYSGPNIETVLGFPSRFSTDNTQSLVKDLRDNGYTVISVLYRLTKLGTTNAQIISNGNKMDTILNDIEDAIQHFRNKMSDGECALPQNYTKYHIVGESAGGHIALMYAYTRGDTSFVKSVTSLYAPTNMSQFANWISNPASNLNCLNGYNAGTNTDANTCNNNLYSIFSNIDFPFYWLVIRNLPLISSNYFDNGCRIHLLINTFRLFKGINLLKVLLGKPSPTSSDYESISPAFQTKVGNIPTFIIHGNNDALVPYNQATLNMENKLSLNGNVLSQNNVCPSTAFPASLSQKHLIRLYNGVGHGMIVENNSIFHTEVLNKTRSDIINWISIH